MVPTLTFQPKFLPTDTALGHVMQTVEVKSSLATANVPITVSITAQNTNGSPILGGTVTELTDAAGVAQFKDLYVYGGTSKQVTMTAQAGADVAKSATFQVTQGGDHLYLTTQLTNAQIPNAVAGTPLPVLTVYVLDANGAIDKSDGAAGGPPGDTIQLYIDHNPGNAKFIDTQPKTAVIKKGMATFTGVTLDMAGDGYTLGVEAVGNDLLTSGTSNAFLVTAAPTR